MLKQIEERSRYAKETRRTSAGLKWASCEPTSMNFYLIKKFWGCQFFSNWIQSAPGLPGALALITLLLPAPTPPTLFKYNHIGIRLCFTQGIKLATDFKSKLGVSIIPWYFEYKLRRGFFFNVYWKPLIYMKSKANLYSVYSFLKPTY